MVEFGILGPLRVLGDDGKELVIRASRQRVLLASLLVRAGQVVSAETLAEYVWDGEPPPGSRTTLQSYVMRLRRLLGPQAGLLIRTKAPGYLIDADAELDFHHFERLRGEGQQAVANGDWERAVTVFGAALALWRGEALEDVPSDVLRHAEGERLTEARMVATELWAEAELRSGRARDVVPELSRLCAAHPHREGLHGLLMTALYRSGRRADALRAFVSVRRRLVDEVGVEPGPQLVELHARILADDPALSDVAVVAGSSQREAFDENTDSGPKERSDTEGRPYQPSWGSSAVIPRQLPPTIRHFTGRYEELKALTKQLEEADEATGAVVITALGGMGGIGKTTLAVHWAHQTAAAFPDGQLYVDLRGFSPDATPLNPAEAVRGFLEALGVPPSRIPVSADAQYALYRSMVAGKRVLVVLDNARDAAQVRPLLPGTVSCMALITSRRRLTSLVATEGAQILDLDVFSRTDARELLVRQLGTLPTAYSATLDELAELCSGLPLALSIAAARASGGPDRLVEFVDDLRQERSRLDALNAGDQATDLRGVFACSYQHLDAPAARMFRMLGLHPGPDISLPAAASLAGYSLADVRRAVEDLTQAHLLTRSSSRRYALHDLLLAHATEKAGDLSAAERDAAFRRMMDHYLHSGFAASRRLSPRRHKIMLGQLTPGTVVETPADAQQAVAWFEREIPVLFAVARRAAAIGLDTYAWQIPWTLHKYLHQTGRRQELISVGLMALTAATRTEDQDGQADIHADLGVNYSQLGAFAEGQAHLMRALELYTTAGNVAGQFNVHLKLAVTCEARGHPRDALDHALKSLKLSRLSEDPRYEGDALCTVGWFYALCGEFDQSLEYCQHSLRWFRAMGDRHGEAAVLDTLGYSHHHLGRHDQAIDYYQQALQLFRDVGDRYNEATILNHLGDVHEAVGAMETARDAWQQAFAIKDDLGHVDAEKLNAKIEGTGSGAPPEST